MSAQMVRMNTSASNLANAGNVAGNEADAYRPLKAVFAQQLDSQSGLSTVRVASITRSSAGMIRAIRWRTPMAMSGQHRSMKMPRWSRCSTARGNIKTWSRRSPPPSN